MNTNGNVYTVVYTTVVVALVAAILAFASQVLAPKQDENVKAETIGQMLAAAKFYEKSELEAMGNSKVLEEYVGSIQSSILVNAEGQEIGSLDKEKSEIYTTGQLKAQNKLIKDGKTDNLALPVFIFSKDGQKVTVIPCYGAGLWGPIWGYLAISDDLTIVGAYFDHESETPGLGAKIKDDPSFRQQFEGKKIDFEAVNKSGEATPFEVVKGGAPKGQMNAVDAITGASITSKALGVSIATWLNAYKPYLTSAKTAVQTIEVSETPAEQADTTAVAAE